MRIERLHIRNFRFIRDLEIRDIENALILVGKNNVGKTAVLNAICAAGGQYEIAMSDFNEKKQNVEIDISLRITEEDLKILHRQRKVSSYRRPEIWMREFQKKLPSYRDGLLTFSFSANYHGRIRLSDGYHKHNPVIKEVFPKIYYVDSQRDIEGIQDTLLSFMEDDLLNQMRADCCIFERSKKCSHCFSCIGLITQKTPAQLNAFETQKLLEYKLYQLNLDDFSQKVNENFRENGGTPGTFQYELTCNTDRIFQVNARFDPRGPREKEPVSALGKGMRSIYLLSLLEAYLQDEERIPGLILMEDPEIFLHPSLQKKSSEILYRLSTKSQVIFTTHSPNLLFQFHSRQIRQMVLDQEGYPVIREETDLSAILDDLGFSAGDLLNVSFVFIVEGKQDKSRLPLLLEKYYSEIYDEDGKLSRIAVISTNSCTNIKTYANLKYMNQTYLRENFLMIRDGDGRDPEELAGSLCRYYESRNQEDADRLPRVTRNNVLILKYYSFENYFLDPAVMAQIGVIQSEEEFFEILFQKWEEYLHRLRSGRHLTEILGHSLSGPEDVKKHMEEIRIYVRGHNLYDIFYGRFRKNEEEILRAYIQAAPRDTFRDILDAIDRFVYFENRKR
ncbi:MAG TPA: AAA family ATPase [Candidatus Blautia faecipullorum]|nr:AAA family ATPase [Candidatus Blautia faecipullorum]